MSIDFAALRKAGLLAHSKTCLSKPDYKQFLEGTGFDYKRDLDSLIASFSHSGNYFIARGRFNGRSCVTTRCARAGRATRISAACRVAGPSAIFHFCLCGTMPSRSRSARTIWQQRG